MHVVVACNLVIMALQHTYMDGTWVNMEEDSNYVFTGLLALEAIIKLAGFGPAQFFFNLWNAFDFVLLVGSIVSCVPGLGYLGTVFRIFRILRVGRLIRASPPLRRLLRTLLYSLPAFMNVLVILGLNVFVFAVIGMALLSGVRYGGNGPSGGYLSTDANFDTFSLSFITLIRAGTGENFLNLGFDLTIAAPYCVAEDGSTAAFFPPGTFDGSERPNCGVPMYTVALFWVAYFTMTNFVLISLVTAVVLEAFEEARDDMGLTSLLGPTSGGGGSSSSSSSGGGGWGDDGEVGSALFRLTHAAAELYARLWAYKDPTGCMLLPLREVVPIVADLPWPLGIAGSPALTLRVEAAAERLAARLAELRPGRRSSYADAVAVSVARVRAMQQQQQLQGGGGVPTQQQQQQTSAAAAAVREITPSPDDEVNALAVAAGADDDEALPQQGQQQSSAASAIATAATLSSAAATSATATATAAAGSHGRSHVDFASTAAGPTTRVDWADEELLEEYPGQSAATRYRAACATLRERRAVLVTTLANRRARLRSAAASATRNAAAGGGGGTDTPAAVPPLTPAAAVAPRLLLSSAADGRSSSNGNNSVDEPGPTATAAAAAAAPPLHSVNNTAWATTSPMKPPPQLQVAPAPTPSTPHGPRRLQLGSGVTSGGEPPPPTPSAAAAAGSRVVAATSGFGWGGGGGASSSSSSMPRWFKSGAQQTLLTHYGGTDPVLAVVLMEAEKHIRSLHLVPDATGRVHFHALLQVRERGCGTSVWVYVCVRVWP